MKNSRIYKFSFIALTSFLVACGPKKQNTETNARVMIWHFVEKRLKNPADADFGSCPVEKIDSVNYRTQCYVDATNGFGAKLRKNFTCQVKYIKGKTWELVDLQFED
jgi:hypothetical protein